MSEIRANTISDAAGTGPVTLTGQSAAKAWVNFNGTGTVAIRESGNVSSITDNGTGDYTVNFTSAFSDVNYTQVSSSAGGIPVITNYGVMVGGPYTDTPTTSSFRLYVATSASLYDASYLNIAFIR